MYLSNKKHLLSQTLIAASLIQLLSTATQHVLRNIMRGGSGGYETPDSSVWAMQHMVIACSIILTVVIFFIALKKVRGYINVVDKEDRHEMGRLQEDKLGESLSTLPAEMIRRLLGLWAVILISIEVLQTLVLIMYRKFISDAGALSNSDDSLTLLYSHMEGLKNLMMIFALLLGVIITAVMLVDRMFTTVSVIIAVVLLSVFCILNIKNVELFGTQVGIGWTSIALQVINTVGIVIFAIYLRVKYKGV